MLSYTCKENLPLKQPVPEKRSFNALCILFVIASLTLLSAFFIVNGFKIIWHISFAYTGNKIIGYVGFVCTHANFILLCLWVPICSTIVTVCYIPSLYINLPGNCFVVNFLTHISDFAKHFYIWHSQWCWANTWYCKESAFNIFIIMSFLYGASTQAVLCLTDYIFKSY